MRKIPEETIRKASKPSFSVLASEVASSKTDPHFYSALQILPNPDPVLRKLGMATTAYDAISYDSHVMGELRAIRGGLLKNEWRVMPGGDEPKDIEAYELVKAIFNRPPARSESWSDLIWNMQSSVFNGFSVSEVIWHRDGQHIVPLSVTDKPIRRFKFGIERELRILSKHNQLHGDVVPDHKFLLARHMPNNDNPYGVAVFSALFWPYTFKHNGFRWCAKFVQRYGIPSPIGRYPIGTQLPEQEELKNNLAKMIEDAVAVVPEGVGVELLEAKPGSHTPHIELINLCNREMSKALTSQTLGSEVTEAGSRSTAYVQQDRQSNNSESDSEMVQRNMQTLCGWITELNFEAGTKEPIWQFYNETNASESQAKTMAVITSIAPVKTDELYAKLQLTRPEKGDDVIFNGASAPQPGNEFSQGGCEHSFSQTIKSELERVADQADDEGSESLERVINAVEELLAESTDLDDFEERLPEAIGVADISEFRQSIENSTVLATAIGFDRGQ